MKCASAGNVFKTHLHSDKEGHSPLPCWGKVRKTNKSSESHSFLIAERGLSLKCIKMRKLTSEPPKLLYIRAELPCNEAIELVSRFPRISCPISYAGNVVLCLWASTGYQNKLHQIVITLSKKNGKYRNKLGTIKIKFEIRPKKRPQTLQNTHT